MKRKDLLLKGFEVELFTGTDKGEHIGVSADVTKELLDFVKEPDQRNLEYITIPKSEYLDLKSALIAPRIKLRNWLKNRNLTILPGSTLSLGDSKTFQRSDTLNSYHEFIEKNYGTKVVTTSVHINLGIQDLSLLFSALRLVRCESALFLALSASSPFLDERATGMHSQRWAQFPLTPLHVPLFLDHSHYVKWVEEQIHQEIMTNVRHLWTSVRPNGPNRPHEINRMEVRICDLITDCDLLLAVTALLELRVLSLFNRPDSLDPLKVSKFSLEELAQICDMNDSASAATSLDSTLCHWLDGKEITCRDWICELLEDVKPLAIDLDLLHILSPIYDVLSGGNQSIQWLKAYSSGQSIQRLMQQGIKQMEVEELEMMTNQAVLG